MSELNLGHIVTDPDARRDAIHVAVAPVVAGMRLSPGTHVGFLPTGRVGTAGRHIGIVDPFLREDVEPGQRFWLFLYPGTITGLRHEWSHPSFVETRATYRTTSPNDSSDWMTQEVYTVCREMYDSRDYSSLPILADALTDAGCPDERLIARCRSVHSWRPGAARIVCSLLGGEPAESVRWIEEFASELEQTYERLMDAAEDWEVHGEWTYDNSERYKDVDSDKWPVFWKHYERVTGRKPKEDDTHAPFTCSC